MRRKNCMRLEIPALSENESFARVAVGAFMARMNPTLEEISDVKTAVSEAVTNAIVHGYENAPGEIVIEAEIADDTLSVEITDRGRGIADVALAMQPFYTSRPEQERSGMGFTVMQTFMSSLDVISTVGAGTIVKMAKKLVPVTGEDAQDER
jgi:stage II sporulation protein AB (anti-sigma F factor)